MRNKKKKRNVKGYSDITLFTTKMYWTNLKRYAHENKIISFLKDYQYMFIYSEIVGHFSSLKSEKVLKKNSINFFLIFEGPTVLKQNKNSYIRPKSYDLLT